MAKTGVVETDSTTMVGKVTELKELQRLVKAIVEEEDSGFETFDRAIKTLVSLKESKFKKSLSVQLEPVDCPEHFRCPISHQLMIDPVIVATGQTYDRHFIQAWLDSGFRTCPHTQQVLSHTNLIPNNLVRTMISQWCKNQGLELPSPVRDTHEKVIASGGKELFELLMKKVLSTNTSEQNKAAKELRLLTKGKSSFRELFGKSPESIPQLISPLLQNRANWDNELHENLVTTVFNISIDDDNKQLVAETPEVIPLLIESLRTTTIAIKSNAAAALFTLSALDSNKHVIGKSFGVFQGLVDLIEEGIQLPMKDAASAIFNLCVVHENRGKAVEAGAVKVIFKKIKARVLVDGLLATLAMLANHQKALDEMGELGAIPCMFSIIREENSCGRIKENGIVVVYGICFNDRTKFREVREEENAFGTISSLAENGTARARRKAGGILERLTRFANITHTA